MLCNGKPLYSREMRLTASVPNWYTANAVIHATTVWKVMVPTAHLSERNSRRIAEKEAMQGAYSSTNTRNAIAATGVNIPCSDAIIAASLAGASRMFSVPTTASFATKPLSSATEVSQFCPNPSGINSGEIHLPMVARMLLPVSPSPSN